MAADRAFLGVAALLFLGSAAVTIAWCGSMSAMPDMEMAGGWTMSMAWMRMPGQTWAGAAGTFLGMWSIMMLAMMLPAIVPALRTWRRANSGTRMNTRTARLAAGYFLVWVALGAVVFAAGVALARLEMQRPAFAQLVPTLASLVLLIAGALQLTRWKERQLAGCRHASGCRRAAAAGSAWRHGVELGLRCCACCAPLTALLLVVGVMDRGAMAAASIAIALERLMPRGRRIARVSGVLLIGAGLVMFTAARGGR